MNPYWTEQDFEVFETPGLEERMEALSTYVRPKFEALGQDFSAYFSGETGDEFFPHVAKHMRRTVNPPNDSWVAFAPYKRGYKAVPHFQIGLWESHVFVILAVIYEAPGKPQMANQLISTAALADMPEEFVVSGDHMKPEAETIASLGEEGIEKLLTRLRDVKKGELVIGRQLARADAAALDKDGFYAFAEETFRELLPIYRKLLQANEKTAVHR
ncbi:YktB family protein [Planococcus sp. 11815]|uniref:YktB family protein n=1 Tax=Planococcus sp. 11815 TaxID=2939413 RepID=UPI003DA55E9D